MPDAESVIAARVAHVLRHPLEAVTAETVHRSHHASAYIEAGVTEHFIVEYQRNLGYAGQVLAKGVLNDCERDFAQLTAWFGGLVPAGLPFRVSVVRGSFGAFHDTCADTHIRCAAFNGHNAELVEMLNVAEVIEVFSAAQNAGWNCGASNGEGLSRVLATELHPSQLDGFATAADWLNSSRGNFVDHTEPTDVDAHSTGCSVLFLNYLHYQLGHDWTTIVAHGRPTLGATYKAIEGHDDGWPRFSALVSRHYRPGIHAHVPGDNIFPLME